MGIYATVARIGRDAEVRSTGNGTSVAGFPAAVDVGFGDHKQTLWLDCSLWGKRAEGGLIPLLTKGKEVFVSGEIGTREFQKRDGTPGFAVTLKIAEIDLVGGKGQGGNQQQNYGGQQGNQQPQQNNGYQQQPQNQPQQNTQQPNQPPQNQQPQQNYGAPDPGQFADFDDGEIPF